MLEFLLKRVIIWVGGRSKSKELEDCNLKVFIKKYRRNYDYKIKFEEIYKNKLDMVLEIEYCNRFFIKVYEVFLEFCDLEDGMIL